MSVRKLSESRVRVMPTAYPQRKHVFLEHARARLDMKTQITIIPVQHAQPASIKDQQAQLVVMSVMQGISPPPRGRPVAQLVHPVTFLSTPAPIAVCNATQVLMTTVAILELEMVAPIVNRENSRLLQV